MSRLKNVREDEMGLGVDGAVKFIIGALIFIGAIALISEGVSRFWPPILTVIVIAVGVFIFVKMRNRAKNTVWVHSCLYRAGASYGGRSNVRVSHNPPRRGR